ncbi:acetyltransferase [Photobacterium angustum]|uniref:acetyltransferase n=1 Tax=Photobacterium angustum TaxID=661 RepID=UPI003D0AB9A7
MKKLAIIGAGGHSKVVAEIAELTGWKNIAFYDDRWPDETRNGLYKILGTFNDYCKSYNDYDGVVIAIGNNSIRANLHSALVNLNAPLVSLIHPRATVSSRAIIGSGTVVMANAVINPDVLIGSNCIINSSSIIEHDCEIADHVHICPNSALAGNVKVHEKSWIGISSTIIQQVVIGREVFVGAGSTVIRDVPDNLKVVGTPAKKIVNC